MIIAYAVIMLALPVIYFFFDSQSKPLHVTVNLDLSQKVVSISGSSFAMQDVTLNDTNPEVYRDKDPNYLDDYKLATSKPTHLILIDKEQGLIDLTLVLTPVTSDIKTTLGITAKLLVASPIFNVNQNRQVMNEQRVIESTYAITSSNIALDISYKKMAFPERMLKFSSQSLAVTSVLTKKITPFLANSLKVIYKFFHWLVVTLGKLVTKLFIILGRCVLALVKYLGVALRNILHFLNGLLRNILKEVGTFVQSSTHTLNAKIHTALKPNPHPVHIKKAVPKQIPKHVLKQVPKQIHKVTHNVIPKVTPNAILKVAPKAASQIAPKAMPKVVRKIAAKPIPEVIHKPCPKAPNKVWSAIKKEYHYIAYERPLKDKENSLRVKALFSTVNYLVDSTAPDLEFECVNGLGKLRANEVFTVDLVPSNKANASHILGSQLVTTNAQGRFMLSLKFGKLTSKYKLEIIRNKDKNKMWFNTFPAPPVALKNLKKNTYLVAPAGQVLKDAMVLQVLDRFGNRVPDAPIELWERPIDKNDMLKFAQLSADEQGVLRVDYRMADDVKKFFIIAKLKDSQAQVAYSLQSQSKRAENMEIVGSEERQAIIGVPIKYSFAVKLSDKMGNPATDINVKFSLQDEESQEIALKTARSNPQGVAEVRFDTPKKTGGYSVVASCEKFSELEAGYSLLVVPGSAAKVQIVSGDNQVVEWNKIPNSPLQVQVLDSLGNPISDADIHWEKSENLNWYEKDDKTDADGLARASIFPKSSAKKLENVVASAAGSKVAFKVYCAEPKKYQLYLMSKPVIKVFPSQPLPENIVFVLKDQYGHVLRNHKVEFEYLVIRKGVSYQQNIAVNTNKQGLVSYNFIVSDQGDEINFKGKYADGKTPIITWVKIDVIPEDISALNINSYPRQGKVESKLMPPIEVMVADNNGKPVGSINLDINCIRVPNQQLNNFTALRVRTNKQGHAYFSPVLGKTAGTYIYNVRLGNNLNKNITINALALDPEEIVIANKPNALYPVGATVENLQFSAYDKYKNRLRYGVFYYGINAQKKASKNRFNQATIQEDGFAYAKLEMPAREGKYWFYVADNRFTKFGFLPIRARGAQIAKIALKDIEKERLVFMVDERVKDVFTFRATDKFGNPISKAKVSLDLYPLNSDKSEVGVDTQANGRGEGSFHLDFPSKSGLYTAKIYASDSQKTQFSVNIELKPQFISKAKIMDGDNQLANANSKLAKDFAVQLLDAYNNPVANAQVKWSYTLRFKGEQRRIEKPTLSNHEGVARFNFELDSEPGIREIRAYYRSNNKWEYQSFFVKSISTKVSKVELFGGDGQSVGSGEELAENLAVKVLDTQSQPIANLPVVFQIYSVNQKKEMTHLPQEVFTNEQGVAVAKLLAPTQPGEYEVQAYAKAHKDSIVRFQLFVTVGKTTSITSPTVTIQPLIESSSQQEVVRQKIIFNGKEFTSIPQKVTLYTKGQPYEVELVNSSKEPVDIGIQISKRNFSTVVNLRDKAPIIISPSYVESLEQVTLYKKEKVDIPWLKKSKTFVLQTKPANSFNLILQDSVNQIVALSEEQTFNYKITTKELVNLVPLEIIVKKIGAQEEQILFLKQTSQPINKVNYFNYTFLQNGSYLIELHLLLTGQKVYYFVEVNGKKHH